MTGGPPDAAGPGPVAPAVTRTVLRDGSVVEVREMRPSDEAGLVRFHSTLSADTTYLRYFSPHPQLSPSEVHRFTHVDHVDREAIVAVADGEIVGVARFDRVPGGPEAEVAFVVSDAWQGRGLGSALLRNLVDRAVESGIERFTAQTLPRNRRMIAVFFHAGLPHTAHLVDGVVDVVLELPSPADPA